MARYQTHIMPDMRTGQTMAQPSRGSIHPRPIFAVFAVFSMSQHAMQRKNATVTDRPLHTLANSCSEVAASTPKVWNINDK
jgi:hypothetical protein